MREHPKQTCSALRNQISTANMHNSSSAEKAQQPQKQCGLDTIGGVRGKESEREPERELEERVRRERERVQER